MTNPARWGPVLRDAAGAAAVASLTFLLLCRCVGDRYDIPSDSMQPTLYGDARDGDVVYVDKLASAAALRRYDLAVFRHPEGEGRQLVKRVVAFGDEPARSFVEFVDGDLWLGGSPGELALEVKDPLAVRDLRVRWCAWPSAHGRAGAAAPDGRDADGREQDGLFERFLALPAGANVVPPRAPGAPAAAGGPARIELPPLPAPAAAIADLAAGAPGLPPRGWLATARPVDAGFVDAAGGHHHAGGAVQVQDCGMDLQVAAAGWTDLFCSVWLRPDRFAFHWQAATGRTVFSRNGEVVADRRLASLAALADDGRGVAAGAAAGGTAPGAGAPGRRLRLRVEFGFLDGRFFLALDGRADATFLVEREPGWARDPGPTARPLPKNGLALAGAAAGALAVERIEVFRDLYWYRDRIVGRAPSEAHVPAGHVFVLGDNSFDSRDSRMFGPVPLTAFVGRPRIVLGPPARRRWLER